MQKICYINLGVEAEFVFKVTLNQDDRESSSLLDDKNDKEVNVI